MQAPHCVNFNEYTGAASELPIVESDGRGDRGCMCPRLRWAVRVAAVVLTVSCVLRTAAFAQGMGGADIVAQAHSLSEAGEFGAVIRLLEPFVQEDPSSAEAWMLLARHRYWNGDTAATRSAYESALEHHSSHAPLRAAYARFLMESGQTDAALEILRPLGSDDNEAESIRGTLAWWKGDLTRAARHFKNAVRYNPQNQEAVAGLNAIKEQSRPWVRAIGEHGRDSQPLSYRGGHAEGGIFLTPLQTIRIEARRRTFASEQLDGGGGPPQNPSGPSVRENAAATVSRAILATNGYWPRLNLDTEISGGVFSHADTTDWVARVEAAVRLPLGLRLSTRWNRSPYLYTVASISDHVMTQAIEAEIDVDRKGWIGEALIGREHFPDDNSKFTAYGWLLAPIVSVDFLTLRAGYAFSFQNTAEHRYTAVIATAPRPGQPPTWVGRYDPYHTPLNVATHSATASVAVRLAAMLSLHASGSYGFVGSEEAPYVYVSGGAPVVDVYEHSIHPWNVLVRLDAPVTSALALKLEWSNMVTTWYDASAVNLSVYLRL